MKRRLIYPPIWTGSLPPRTTRRRLGLDKEKFVAPPEFFDPLPAEILAGFGEEP